MLQIVLEQAMKDKGLASRKAAEEIGVTHTTILRALRGETVDVDTIIKIANWLKIRPSELLDSMTTDATLPEQLATLLSHSRDLEEHLADAVERVKAGQLDPAVLRDIVSYALFKLNTSGANNVATNPTRPRKRKQ